VGNAVLVKVRHTRLGRRFFLKYLSPQASLEADAVERFVHAARAATRLRSEHVALTVDAGRLACGLPYVVSESFRGLELREIMRVRGAIDVSEAVAFLLQAAHAVAEAHRTGIVHGSLSPSTLFVTPGPEGLQLVKVLEFGSSATLRGNPLVLRRRNWSEGTAIFAESLSLWDTLAYSAPEQVRTLEEATPVADVWALGAILYEMLVGSPPFRAASVTALVAAIVADEPPAPSALARSVRSKLDAVVLRCLSKSPEDRFPSVSALALALRPFASPENQRTADRIARIESYDAEQASSSGSSPALEPVRSAPRPSFGASRPIPRARSVAWAWIGSLLLATLGALGGVLAGTVAARALASRDASSPSVSPPAAAPPVGAPVPRAR